MMLNHQLREILNFFFILEAALKCQITLKVISICPLFLEFVRSYFPISHFSSDVGRSQCLNLTFNNIIYDSSPS